MSSKCLFRYVYRIRRSAQVVYHKAPHALAGLIIVAFVLQALPGLQFTATAAEVSEPEGAPAHPETKASPTPAPKPSPSPAASPAAPSLPASEQAAQTPDPSKAGPAGGPETQSVDDRDPAKTPEHVKQRRAELAQQIADLRLDKKWEKGKEVPELRTARSKTFMGGKPGEFADKLYPSPVHFLEQERWTEIDSNIGRAANGRRRSGANSFGLSVAEQATDGKLVELDLGKGNSVGFSMQAAQSARAKATGNVVEFAGVAKNTDLRLTSEAEGLKEELILHSADSPRTFTFPLVLEGVSASIDEKGGVLYKDGQDRVLAYTPPGIMFDAGDPSTGQPPAFSDGVSYELVAHGSGTALKVSIDDSWVIHPSRRWPLSVDPTFQTVNVFGDDTFVVEDFDYDFSGWQQLYVGKWWDATAGRYWRANSYLHFDTTATWGKQYDVAIMYATELGSVSCVGPPGPVYRTVANNWQASTIDYPGPAIDPAYKSNGTWWSGACNSQTRLGYWDVTPAMQLWSDVGSGDGSVSMRPESDSPSHFKIYNSSEVGGTTRPFINAVWSMSGYPFGMVELAQQVEPGIGEGPAKVKVQGWVLDQDLKTTPVPVRINVRPLGSSDPYDIQVAADDSRPDVGNNYPGYGNNHGYSETILTNGHGSYQACVTGVNIGSNGANTDFACRTLQVVNRPDFPLNVAATRQNPSDPVHVTWAPPASNGGSAITGYKIEARTENGTVAASQTCAAGCTSVDLQGLGDLGDYAFAVSAQNVQGYGPAEVLTPPVPATAESIGLEDFYPYSAFDLGHGTAFANMANGNLVVQDVDFDVPGQGLNMRLTRTYNANNDGATGPFGRGWSLGVSDGESAGSLLSNPLDLSQTLKLLFGGAALVFTDQDGTRHRFVNQGGVWKSPPGVNLTLIYDLLGNATLTRPDGVSYKMKTVGEKLRMDEITDRKGNVLKFVYTGAKLSSITDAAGRSLTFTQPANLITQISFNAAGQSLATEFDYTGDRLVSVVHAAGTSDAVTTEYTYSSDRLRTVKDGRANSTTFDISGQELSKITDRAGKEWGFTSCTPENGGVKAICLTDPEAKTERWSSNATSNPVAVSDAGDVDTAGTPRTNTRKYEWTGNRLTKSIDQKDNTATYGYTTLGSIETVTRPGGNDVPITTTMGYQQIGTSGAEQMTTSTTGDRIYQYFHNTDGTLEKVIDPEDNETRFEYHLPLGGQVKRGLLAKVIDANLHGTKYGDESSGAAADRGYDPSGYPKKITDPRTGPAAAFSTYTYDFLGRTTKTVDREGKEWLSNYFLRGNLRSAENPEDETVYYCYDQNDNLKLVVPARSTLAPACNSAGEDGTLDGTDAHSTKLTYDARDLPSSTMAKSVSGQSLDSAGIKRTEFDYYPDGELKIVREPRSFDAGTGLADGPPQETLYEYYPNNRLAKVSGPVLPDSERALTTAVYDERGLPVKVTEPKSSGTEGPSTTYVYNKPGQVTSAKVSNLSPATFDYNVFGDRVKMTTPEGQGKYSTTYVPDKLGRTLTVTQPAARAAGDASAGPWQKLPTTITHEYDGVGNLKSITQPTGESSFTKVAYTYWENNLLKTETDPFEDPDVAQRIIHYDHDKEGRQKLRRDMDGTDESRKSEWEFNDDGTVKFETSTGAGLPTHRSQFGYDADNNLTSVKTADNVADPVVANISEITNHYTSQGELEKLTEAIFPPGTTASVVKTSFFTWQRDGVIKKHKVDGEESEFGHRLDRLESSFTPFNGTDIFEAKWFNNGSLEQLKLPNGAEIDNLYDSVSRLEDRQVTTGSTVLSAWTDIDYDDNGNRLSEITSQRKLDGSDLRTGTATYGYDQLDRQISNHHPFDTGNTKVGYTLDNAGNVTAESAVDGPASDIQGFVPTTLGYTNNRLSARDPEGDDDFSYQYDDSGNQKFERIGTAEPPVGTANSYDAASHPQRTTMPDGKWAEYTYDGLGRQVTRSTDSGETTLVFHFGLVDQPAVEIATRGPDDATTTRYLLNSFGAPLGQQVTVRSPDDGDPDNNPQEVVSSSYFVPDLRGNLSQLLGASTSIKGIFAYDPYGKAKQELEPDEDENLVPTDESLTNLAAGSDSRLRYQMAPHDPLTGNYSLGRRLLNPNINRFVGADFYAAGAANMALQVDPLTGNRYMYAGANPAGLIDDGHSALSPCWGSIGWCDEDDSDTPVKTIGSNAVTFAPGYDCVQTVMDPSWGSAGWCAVDFIPLIGKADEVVQGAKLVKKLVKDADKAKGADELAAFCRGSSFVPGTEVLMADGSTKPIEQVEVGDWVWAADPETGEQGPRQVTDLIMSDGYKDLVDIVIDDDLVTSTDQHPFWVDDQGRWVDAEDLASGDLLLLADGSTVQVDRVSQRSAVQRVHNLTVDGIHTYFVVAGEEEVLVHNCTVDDLMGLASEFDADELAQFAYKHAGEGDFVSTPTIDQISKALSTKGTRLADQNAVRFTSGETVVIINEDLPWRSTAYIKGGG
jgi:RHS repeat-associated protein